MKTGLILLAVLQSLWSVEIGLATFHYGAGYGIFWSGMFCLVLGLIDLNLYYWLAEKGLRVCARRWPQLGPWLNKFEPDGSSPWVRRIFRWRYWGLFLAALIPHFLFAGVATQKIFRFPRGYWFLMMGTALKALLVAGVFKLVEHGIPYLFNLVWQSIF